MTIWQMFVSESVGRKHLQYASFLQLDELGKIMGVMNLNSVLR